MERDMELAKDAGALFDHFEHHLGKMKSSFKAKMDGDFPFMVLVYPPQPSGTECVLVTCGLSAHRLHVAGQNRTTRMELAILAKAGPSMVALNALLTAVALHLFATHESPGIHGVLPGEGPVLEGGNTLFESFYLRAPVGVPEEFSTCEAPSSKIEILQLIPITSNEERMLAQMGWQAFEQAVVQQQIDLLDFDARQAVHY